MVYEADRPVTVLEVLAEAGGIATTQGDSVIISRAGIKLPPLLLMSLLRLLPTT